MLTGKKIIIGVTGSIAAYKAALLVRLLRKAEAEVRVVLTPGAEQFVRALTFTNLSQHPAFTGLWDGDWTEHVHLGAWADLLVVAPATANTLAKLATGLCDNALTAVYLAAKCPTLVAPAMDADMYIHPTTKRNLKQLSDDGVTVMESGHGFLASGLHGPGRMPEPEEIVEAIVHALTPKPLRGKRVLISAGPTREYLDPVRFLSNGSTGTMGYALAREAHRLGAEVTLVSGRVTPPLDLPFAPVFVTSTQNMYAEITARAAEQHIIVMAAAVGDYAPRAFSENKIKKGEGDLTLPLRRTPDILRHLGGIKPEGQILVGFALETQNETANAHRKLEAKNLDYIVLNSLRDAGAGFGPSTNKITLINRKGEETRYPTKAKPAVARDILDTIINDLQL
ncbi:MAG: bifunctional phosphopantothenoylcysteine decarboxylase/phosphopantothenate--cysteine ligase CoaBC [Bacteroidota bacterium]